MQLSNHPGRIGAAHVIAFEQHLSAAAGAHDLAAQLFKAHSLAIGPHHQSD
jgi:hypothetical protein